MKKIFLALCFVFWVPAVQAGNNLSDGEIAQILLTANSIDVGNGELAKDKATHPDVKTFAERMVKDHNDNNKEAQELMKKIDVTLKDNSISTNLSEDAEKSLKKLKDTDNKGNFDKDYIKAEIELHKKVIEVAESQLVPNAKNKELKALLEKTHPVLISHLEHAKKVLDSLK